MPVRPEGSGGGYDEPGHDDFDQEAWQEFTPWRPGDPSTSDEAPASYAGDFSAPSRYIEDRGEPRPGSSSGEPAAGPAPRGFRWSEDSRKLRAGDDVRAGRALGEGVLSSVPPGEKGRIVSTEVTAFGERGTVRFENGYELENVDLDHLDRRGWFD